MMQYASTCAAVENMLLSLHSEGYSTKWTTGSLTRTLAFRNLIEAHDDELVTGLIFVGEAANTRCVRNSYTRRLRRQFEGDLLQEF